MRRDLVRIMAGVAGFLVLGARGERINHAGRILGPEPVVTHPILFHTPEADAVVAAMQIFPATHGWNEDVSGRPVLTNSDAMMLTITTNLLASRRHVRVFYEMNFVLIPDDQPLVPINFNLHPRECYPEESDLGPYPIPTNMPVETWPRDTGPLTLSQWQEDTNGVGGDRHAIIVQPGAGGLWELWRARLTNGYWEAANGAKWNLHSNALRPLGWTSADAAGLPMFGGLIRYDECQRGEVEHACRLVVARTRTAYIYPATHHAGSTTGSSTPAMGQRLRLKSDYSIPAGWTLSEKAVAKALKKYGAIVSDNGGFFSLSAVPDPRWSAGEFTNFRSLSLANFEVVLTTGEFEGPRSPGAPAIDAGPDQRIPLDSAAALLPAVIYTNAEPLSIVWISYAGPGSVHFEVDDQAAGSATFSTSGVYTLLVKADNGVHASAYDAVAVTVEPVIRLEAALGADQVAITWRGVEAGAESVLECATTLLLPDWVPVATNGGFALLPGAGTAVFFRVRQP
jgi:hypothetical protein